MTQPKLEVTKKTVAKEVAVYRKVLKANDRVGKAGTPLKSGATHVEHKDKKGAATLERKRFSAI